MKRDSVAAVAVCPHPPMLVPEVASGAAPELRKLRAACDEAIRRMYAVGVAAVVVLAGAGQTRRYPAGSRGDFNRYGVAGIVAGFGNDPFGDDPGDGAEQLPLGLLVGAWLLARGGRTGHFGQTIAATAPPQACAELGRALDVGIDSGPDVAGPVGLLVLGDGSARRTDRAPGALHPDAAEFDRSVADALRSADVEALRALDPQRAETLMAGGRAAWQVLAAVAGERAWRAELLHHAAPYGVAYFVASWSAA